MDTDSEHAWSVVPHLIEQNFTASRLDEKWGADISYVLSEAVPSGDAAKSATRLMRQGNPLRHLASIAGGLWPTARREAGWLLGLLLVAAAMLAFADLAGEVLEGDTRAFDRAALLVLRNPADPGDPIGPRWLEEVARDVTSFGANAILAAFTLAVIGFLALTEKRAAAVLVAVSVGGGTALSSLLKLGFSRPRPDLVPHAVEVYTASFPSGHAMLSAVTYLTLGALLVRVQPRWRVRLYILALASATTILVGASRVYLGVLWPTDVLAGWCVGAAWALLCWLVALRLQRAGRVEVPVSPSDGDTSR